MEISLFVIALPLFYAHSKWEDKRGEIDCCANEIAASLHTSLRGKKKKWEEKKQMYIMDKTNSSTLIL